ncbi:odorant receptor Or2-like [Cylas formicarius]|uniref:odorant receptor Or2-like n=1 Tax=Cylas formicarius TaxID=197179 RepID=UPI0029589FC0|nr:odorant receptor Or2-like [Cylas formicarius]
MTTILTLSKCGMIAAGIWRFPVTTRPSFQILYALYSICIQVYLAIFVVSMVIRFAILSIHENHPTKESVDLLFTAFAYLISFLVTQIKAVICQTKPLRRIICYIIEEEENLSNSGDEEILAYHRRQIALDKKINWAIFYFTALLGSAAIVSNAFLRVSIGQLNSASNSTVRRPFVYELYYYKVDTEKRASILVILNAFSVLVAILMGVSTQSIFLTCIIFASSVLKALQVKLKKMSVGDNDMTVTLAGLVKEHQRVVRFIKQLNEAVKHLMLMDYFLNAMNMALVMLLFLEAETGMQFASCVFYSGRMMVIIFALGWTSNEIKVQSQGLADAIYESGWYERPLSVRRLLHMMILRAQRPLALTIGPFDEMTIQSSLTIMKAAYTYGTVMMQKYQRE